MESNPLFRVLVCGGNLFNLYIAIFHALVFLKKPINNKPIPIIKNIGRKINALKYAKRFSPQITYTFPSASAMGVDSIIAEIPHILNLLFCDLPILIKKVIIIPNKVAMAAAVRGR